MEVDIKKTIIKDDAELKKPALRLSLIVYGREHVGTKVKYLIDPKGQGDKKEIPENIVLIRWRKKISKGYTFSGDRLGPNVWRGLSTALGADPNAAWLKWTAEEIASQLHAARDQMGIYKSSVPNASAVHALIQICGVERLKAIFARHLDPNRSNIYGTPDLFLFARDFKGKECMGRFVEVKKPEEPFKSGQSEEIMFLQSLGLHARVVRLIERS